MVSVYPLVGVSKVQDDLHTSRCHKTDDEMQTHTLFHSPGRQTVLYCSVEGSSEQVGER